MAQIYDRPVSELMRDAAAALTYPTKPSEVVAWFGQQYPLIKPSTIRAHVKGLTADDPSRHHYAWLVHRDPLFMRNQAGQLVRYSVERGETDEPEVDQDPGDAGLEFALEAYLEEFLLTNWHAIDWGRPLELWESPSSESGNQLTTPVGRLDFLCRDSGSGALVVVELKRGRPSDRVVGQAARYMGWVRAHVAAEDQAVEGIIVARDQSDQLAYAVSAVPNLSVLTYQVDFKLMPAAGVGTPAVPRVVREAL